MTEATDRATMQPLPPTWRRVAAVWWAFYWRLMAASFAGLIAFLALFWRGAAPTEFRSLDILVVLIIALLLMSTALGWALGAPYAAFELGVSDGQHYWRGKQAADEWGESVQWRFLWDVSWRCVGAFLVVSFPAPWLFQTFQRALLADQPTGWFAGLILLPTVGSIRMLCERPGTAKAPRLVFLPRAPETVLVEKPTPAVEGDVVEVASSTVASPP